MDTTKIYDVLKKTLLLSLCVIAFDCLPKEKASYPVDRAKINGIFTDPRDGQKYPTVKIGEQSWMAKNLNYQTENSWCYNNDNTNCKKYGRLYDWNTAMNICPKGWRLPTVKDWNSLPGGHQLKSKKGWVRTESTAISTDPLGFSALPGGGYDAINNRFLSGDSIGYWWSSREYGSHAWYRYITYIPDFEGIAFLNKRSTCSVRCVKNSDSSLDTVIEYPKTEPMTIYFGGGDLFSGDGWDNPRDSFFIDDIDLRVKKSGGGVSGFPGGGGRAVLSNKDTLIFFFGGWAIYLKPKDKNGIWSTTVDTVSLKRFNERIKIFYDVMEYERKTGERLER